MPVAFAADSQMPYAAARTRFSPGQGLVLDEPYRRAHLPLIAPGHPDVIAEGGGYRMGIHAPGFSLVLPVDAEALAESPAYRDLEAALKASSFAAKIAWDLLPKRAARLHATIIGGLDVVEGRLPEPLRVALEGIPAIPYELRGLFSGNRNLGRLYLAVYPAMRAGEPAFAAVQRALGCQPNAMILMGQFNLVDHLDAGEAVALASLLDVFRETLFLTATAEEVRVLRSADDLVLDAAYTDRLRLR